MQRQVAAARRTAGLERRAVAERVGVSERTLFDWEKCYDRPSTPHFVTWAYACGLRLVLIEPEINRAPVPVSLEPGESLVVHELRPIAVWLKARRTAREISQADMGRLVGVSRSALQRWEDDGQVPSVLHLIAWADRLGCRLVLMPERC